MAILEELKAKANGKADTANNIQEAISMMEFGGGSSGGIMVINNDDTATLDKTWQEIYDAVEAGTFCIVKVVKRMLDDITISHCPVLEVKRSDGGESFSVTVLGSTENIIYTANSAAEYPRHIIG